MNQQIKYADINAVEQVVAELSQLPPLIQAQEVDKLKAHITDAQQGRSFVLQGGDCAESFADCNSESITKKIRLMMSLSLELSQRLNKPIVRIGRIAGQYAKPRSQADETQGQTTLPSYRGDLVNHIHFSESARLPDPQRLLQGYNYAAHTVNYIRALLDGPMHTLFDLSQETSDLEKITPLQKPSESLLHYSQAMTLLQQVNGPQAPQKGLLEFFTSHEALHLHYEQALTRGVTHGVSANSQTTKWYNLSTHFPWLGMRTAVQDSAHVEYLRGIENPIAIKVGPSMTPDALIELCQQLNPINELGKITLIHRFGAEHIAKNLPPLIQAIQSHNMNVLWCCDPMHGNTISTASGHKTRELPAIMSEITQAFSIHQEQNSYLGGLHLEMTAESVLECTDATSNSQTQLNDEFYKSLVDPRLNVSQAFTLLQVIPHSTQNQLGSSHNISNS